MALKLIPDRYILPRLSSCKIDPKLKAENSCQGKFIIWFYCASSHHSISEIFVSIISVTSDEQLDNSSMSSAVRNLFLDSKSVCKFGRHDIEPRFKYPIALLDKFKVLRFFKHVRFSIFSILLLCRYKFFNSLRWLKLIKKVMIH